MRTATTNLVLFILFFIASSPAILAQPVGRTVDSLEWRCARSSTIVRGFVQDFRVPADQSEEPYRPEFEFTIQVTESIKGTDQPTFVFRHVYDRREIADLEKIKASKKLFLLFVDKSETPRLIPEPYPEAFPITHPEYKYVHWSNGRPIEFDNEDQYAEKVKEIVAENSKYKSKESYDFTYGNFFGVRIPLDKRAETLARTILQGKNPNKSIIPYGGGLEGVSAVELLAKFRSKDNEAIIEKMLNDSTDEWIQKRSERTTTGQAIVKEYGVRNAAFQILSEWGIEVEKPVMRETTAGPSIAESDLPLVQELDKEPQSRIVFTEPIDDVIFIREIQFHDVKKLPNLSMLSKLELVVAYCSNKPLDISDIGEPKSLRILDINVAKVDNIDSLSGLQKLENLTLPGGSYTDISPLENLTSLQTLEICKSKVSDLKPLENLTNLKTLDISDTDVAELSALSRLTNLEMLIADRTQVHELTPLKKMAKLSVLSLNQSKVKDISPLASTKNLVTLRLNETMVSDLQPLSKYQKLESLSISHSNVKDLVPIAGIKTLAKIDADDTKVTDVGCLADLSELWYLQVTKGVEIKGLDTVKERLPKITIYRVPKR